MTFAAWSGELALVTAAMFWVGGLDSLIGGMIKGACILCVDDHSPASLLEAVRRDKATHVGGSEAVMRSIAAVPGWKLSDFDRLKVLTASQHAYFVMLRDGATISREQVPDSLGMTETIGPPLMNPIWGERRADAIGRVSLGYTCRVVDENGDDVAAGERGELLVGGVPV